jgi:hypothetical protein
LIGGFVSVLYLGKTMIDMYVICGLLDYGRKVFDEMADRAVHLVIFKHRWRWKFSCWWPPWVPIPGGRDLRHFSRTQMTLALSTFLELLGCTETLGEEDDTGCPHGHGYSCVLHGEDIAVSWCMFLKLRQWRGMIRSQTSFNTELFAGPRTFRDYEMTTATFHDYRFHDGLQWVPTWPWLHIRFAWVRISRASGSKDNRIELESWMVLEARADDVLILVAGPWTQFNVAATILDFGPS